MKTTAMLKILIIAGCLSLGVTLQAVYGEDAWKMDFDVACAQSNEAMALSANELKTLIEKCDRLQKIIETQDETVRKVYLKRLQMCKNLFVFVLETKVQEQAK
jgi:hypothetical protein